MQLNDIHRGITKHRNRKRIGRGVGSGTGKTSGRGHKGHKSRSGYSRKPNFQGGAMPMFRRIPKRGFNNKWSVTVFAVNVGRLNEIFNDGDTVTLEAMSAKNVAKGTFDEVKILGDGEITKKLTVRRIASANLPKKRSRQPVGRSTRFQPSERQTNASPI